MSERGSFRTWVGVPVREGIPRLSEGLPVAGLPSSARPALAGLVADGLVDGRVLLDRSDPRVLLTRRGRLLADAVVRALVA